jgi:hypothetical protein
VCCVGVTLLCDTLCLADEERAFGAHLVMYQTNGMKPASRVLECTIAGKSGSG